MDSGALAGLCAASGGAGAYAVHVIRAHALK